MDERISLDGVSIAIGTPMTAAGMPAQTVTSLVATIKRCTELGLPCSFVTATGGAVHHGRDSIVAEFLRLGASHLFWIDSDIVWAPEDFLRIVALATKVDVVAAAYPAKTDEMLYYVDAEKNPPKGENGLLEINGIGLGFMAVSRKAVNAVAATKPIITDAISKTSGPAVFRFDIIDGNRRGEDMAFCADLREMGFRIWLDPAISLGHIGQKQYRRTA